MFALYRLDVLHRRADLDEFVLRLLPLPLVDQLLNLLKLCRGEGDLVVAGDLRRTEQRRPNAVHRVTGAGSVHGGTESSDAQHCCGDGPDDGERRAGAPTRGESTV